MLSIQDNFHHPSLLDSLGFLIKSGAVSLFCRLSFVPERPFLFLLRLLLPLCCPFGMLLFDHFVLLRLCLFLRPNLLLLPFLQTVLGLVQRFGHLSFSAVYQTSILARLLALLLSNAVLLLTHRLPLLRNSPYSNTTYLLLYLLGNFHPPSSLFRCKSITFLFLRL